MDESPSRLPMNETLESVNTSMIEGLGQLAGYFGFSKVMGQLFGALMLSPDPLSLDDLMERLAISNEVWVKDDRRKYYRAESDFWQILTNILGSRELRDVNQALRVLDGNAAHLQKSLPMMDDDERKLAEFYIQQLDQMQDFFRLAQLLLTSLIQHAKERPEASEITRIDFE
jgi:HTH-type transcriptional regulator, glycine betaine synthesis regulator